MTVAVPSSSPYLSLREDRHILTRRNMALQPDNTLISNREMLAELVMKPLRTIGSILESMAVSNSRTKAIQAIWDIPEEELRAKGLTRADVVSMTFRHDA